MVQQNQLKNNPITPRDVRLMKEILGPSVPGLKGKKVRKQKEGVQPNMVRVPKHVQDHYQEIILAIDIMHVNQIRFLITTSRHIHWFVCLHCNYRVVVDDDGRLFPVSSWSLFLLLTLIFFCVPLLRAS